MEFEINFRKDEEIYWVTALIVAVIAIRPHIESRVSANVAELLTQPDSAWPKAVDEYRQMLPAIAKSLAPGFTTWAVQRQNQREQHQRGEGDNPLAVPFVGVDGGSVDRVTNDPGGDGGLAQRLQPQPAGVGASRPAFATRRCCACTP